ncbi:hypothetical protein [Burkholderia stabilis]|uniref:hypothetical protein n=1 Tax=Burkholderia stabilis TaxID=95485 RepID=UPI001F4B2210|nr:hypothetical protein [Burkholderia stabilis]
MNQQVRLPHIFEIEAAMNKVHAAERSAELSKRVWWDDADFQNILAAGAAAGFLHKQSHTQVHWTESGVQAVKEARAAIVDSGTMPQPPEPKWFVGLLKERNGEQEYAHKVLLQVCGAAEDTLRNVAQSFYDDCGDPDGDGFYHNGGTVFVEPFSVTPVDVAEASVLAKILPMYRDDAAIEWAPLSANEGKLPEIGEPSYLDYVKGAPLQQALWWFIENGHDELEGRTEIFFALRERVRAEGFGSNPEGLQCASEILDAKPELISTRFDWSESRFSGNGKLPEGDVSVIEVASLDDEHAANFSKPFICQHEDCRVVEFDAEDAACAYQRDHRIKNGMDPMTGEAVEVGKLPEKPQLPYKLSDGRIVGTIDKIAFTQGGAGNQWTTISGEKYATWWDIRSRNWNEGDVVAFKASKAPLWHGHPPVAQASNITKFDPALLSELADDADNETAVVRINRREYDAPITSLRLLERNMENGKVSPNDGNLGDILTCSGDHRGLSVRGACTLCDNLLDGKNVTWDAKADKPKPSSSAPTIST